MNKEELMKYDKIKLAELVLLLFRRQKLEIDYIETAVSEGTPINEMIIQLKTDGTTVDGAIDK